jgi:hypothetical protein
VAEEEIEAGRRSSGGFFRAVALRFMKATKTLLTRFMKACLY